MSDDRLKTAIDRTIQHVESLRAAGVTHLDVSPETLEALARPVKPVRIQTANRGAGDPAKLLDELRKKAAVCVKCRELADTRTQVVFGVGNPRAELMFIGEAPGADEDIQGEPFVGRAGQLLTKIIKAMRYERSDIYIANVLKCRPPDNRQPAPQEEENCLPYLVAQVEIIKPKAIVALGAVAMKALLGMKIGIMKLRGNWYEYKGIPLMPTYHPAYLLRNQSLTEKRKVWEDMLKVLEKLGRPITERQRNFFKT